MSHHEYLAQPIHTRPLHKLLHKKLRIPQRVVQPILSAAKMAGHSEQVRLRRKVAEGMLAKGRPATEPAASDGYRLCTPDELPGARVVAALCAELFERKRPQLTPEYAAATQRSFLVPILDDADLLELPELVRFAISRPVLDTAIAYLGAVPVATGLDLLWTPANETVHSSQLYHFDDEDRTQLKLFVAATDTGDEQGPLTFLPADVSRHIRSGIGAPIGRVRDERIEQEGIADRAVRLVGPAGSSVFLDTCRCLHYGSRRNRRDRLVLQIQFLRFEAPAESTATFPVPASLHDLALDPVQRLALGLA